MLAEAGLQRIAVPSIVPPYTAEAPERLYLRHTAGRGYFDQRHIFTFIPLRGYKMIWDTPMSVSGRTWTKLRRSLSTAVISVAGS
jgi:hypothetical protein